MATELLDTFWLIFCIALVALQQAGFMALEYGATQQKNAINVALKNLIDIGIVVVGYYLIGVYLQHGTQFTLSSSEQFLTALYAATAATLISGAIAERTKLWAYLVAGFTVSVLIFPMLARWMWGEAGWLAEKGARDFAGAAVVHCLGGAVALALIAIIGPRQGVFVDDKYRPPTGSSLPIAVLGSLLLWIGWIGFNGGSTTLADGADRVVIATLVAGCAGLLFGLSVTYRYKQHTVRILTISMLGGLVCVTAFADIVGHIQAMLAGVIGGLIAIFADRLMLKMRLDDPVGAVPVHLGAGLSGLLLHPLIKGSDATWIGQLWLMATILSIAIFIYLSFFLLNRLMPMRVAESDEIQGLNISEHNEVESLSELIEAIKNNQETGNLTNPLPVQPNTVEGALATQYNNMMQRVDISHQQLKQQTEVAQEASKAKDNFLAILNHELRTPLNAILGFSKSLSLSDDKETKDKATRIVNAGQRLSRLTEQMLNIKSIESGAHDVNIQPAPLRATIKLCIDGFEVKAEEKHVKLIRNNEVDESLIANIDESILTTIITELLDNAIKFTPSGKTVSVHSKVHDQVLSIAITDQGPGIDTNDQQTIFSVFESLDDGLDRNNDGIGMGLSVASKLAKLVNAKIEVTTSSPQGTQFDFVMPIETQHLSNERSNFTGLSALIVDDAEDNRMIAQWALEDLGFHVETAVDGLDAIEKAQESTYQLILMDMQMPKMDGITATSNIRQRGLATDTPIIALTANTHDVHKQACFDAGMVDFLSKPINDEALLKALRRHVK